MAEVLLFHHVRGLGEGTLAFAAELRGAGHVVHTPDLLEGRTFDSIEDGIAHVQEIGFDTVIGRAAAAAADLPADLVYVGFSLGVLPAQALTQRRPGARGAVLCYSCVPPSEFDSAWPAGVPGQIHMMENDPEVVEGGDLEAARELAASVAGVELFLYPGDRHLFADASVPDYDPSAAALLTERVRSFLGDLS
jgi:dienelactone hydrolase